MRRHVSSLKYLILSCSLTLAFASEWFAFNPAEDAFRESPIDLRRLNEKFAGEEGSISAHGDGFVHSRSGTAVRFWAVNGPPGNLSGEDLRKAARRLAKYGVNLVRLHGAMFGKDGEPDTNKVRRSQEIVAAMKREGIYAHFSIYFPLWMTPAADDPWLKGYNGQKHPFAALMFNPDFQAHYRAWWKALLLTPDAEGRKLVDEPAVFGLEIQNEDSFFFWTFNPEQIPDEQMRILEARFGVWLKKKHGSLESALARWNGQTVKRDNVAEGRVGFRPLWNIANERSLRDQESAQFLWEQQREFYDETIAFLRGLGFKGLITASNWATASPEVLGPLERWSYSAGDFIDRHGYFSVQHKGEASEWSIRNGHTYADRSALRFDPQVPGKPKQFVHPAMEITYDNKPSMISETTWNRPNRFRGEAPLYFACYGALQGTDAIVHFALDGASWSAKPGYWMQPWTLMAPTQMGQFPAAALIYRRGLVKQGELLAKINLNTNDLLALKGTPLPQDANFDELRLKDVPTGSALKPGQRLDPLIHYAGRTAVRFSGEATQIDSRELRSLIDHEQKEVRSSTGELRLDYAKGVLTIEAAGVQGASGNLKDAGEVKLKDIAIQSELDNLHVVLVALDGQAIAQPGRMLLQAMSEERASGFDAEELADGTKRIREIGRDPWEVKEIAGKIRFQSGPVRIQPLDFNGYPSGEESRSTELKLGAKTVYYLVTREAAH